MNLIFLYAFPNPSFIVIIAWKVIIFVSNCYIYVGMDFKVKVCSLVVNIFQLESYHTCD
jgi:hypothetical protein